MRLLSFKPLRKGSLRGFASLDLPIGLKLLDCPVFVGPRGPWVGLPAKPILDRDGMHCRPNGKPQYAAVLEWRDRDLSDRFGAAVVELVRSAYPDAFAVDAPLGRTPSPARPPDSSAQKRELSEEALP